MKFELKPHNRNVSDDEFVSDLKRVAAEINKNGVTIEEYNKRGRFHASTLIRRFGSWFKALEKAGLTKTRNFYGDVPNEKLSADLKRVAGELGKSSVTQDEYNERGLFRSGLLCDRFGSWFKALESAGLNKTRNLNISNEELFENLADVWTKLGRQPSYDDLTSKTSKYSKKTYEKRFTTWRKALEAFVAWANEDEEQEVRQKSDVAHVNSVEKEIVRAIVVELEEEKPFKHKTKRHLSLRLKVRVLMKYGPTCQICFKSRKNYPDLEIVFDHIVPWAKRGETVFENLQPLCRECNGGKGDLGQSE